MLKNLGLITIGSIICAAAVKGILIPMGFVSGGLTGLGLILHYLVPPLSVGTLYFLFNIPLYLIGWRQVGPRFLYYSIAGTFIFSAALEWIHYPIPIHDKLLGALFAGIITGIGSGIILRSAGSAGGTDILSVMLLKRFSIRLGSTILAFNGAVLTLAALLFSLESALYTLIFIYVTAHFMDLVVTGLSQRKAVMIISPFREEIAETIMHKLERGVTFIDARGGYSGQENDILYTVITFRELSHLKRLINRVDPNAFVVISDTREVMGYRIGNQPHW
ncbi:MAG: YitT family protein [Syntrophaceae bacterium]|nr:YitT family protein [Syntrophaceae bacterium]